VKNKSPLYCASDKEIFDVLMASKQRVNEQVLHSLSRDRGIFYGKEASRDWLADRISLLPHDALDLDSIMDRRSPKPRAEKLTCVTLSADLSIEEIKDAVKEYAEHSTNEETVRSSQSGTDRLVMDVDYNEIDYGKTRLIQRRNKKAAIEFIVEGEATIVRFPANDKARAIMNEVKNRIEQKKRQDIQSEEITLEGLNTAELRTRFFIELITKLKGYRLENVTSIRVDSALPKPLDESEQVIVDAESDSDTMDIELQDDQSVELAKEEMLHLVRNIAMKGNSLLASSEYRDLRDKGFYLSAVIWRSKMEGSQTIVEFEAAFEDPEAGRGFKYAARGAFYAGKSGPTKTLRPIQDSQKQELLSLIESTANAALQSLRQEVVNSSSKKSDSE
jgi:hypothetical protein